MGSNTSLLFIATVLRGCVMVLLTLLTAPRQCVQQVKSSVMGIPGYLNMTAFSGYWIIIST